MRRTLRSMKTWAVSALGIVLLSGCTKDDYIKTIEDTYSAYSVGSVTFFDRNETDPNALNVWNIKEQNGMVRYYVSPDVYMLNGQDAAKLSSSSQKFVQSVRSGMDDYSYVYTPDEEDADIVINIVNFRLKYSGIIWTPGIAVDPYYNFWGGYYPWLYPYYITVATNKLIIEAVERESLEAYRSWYNDVWKPANPGKYPSESSVPEDKRPKVVWKCDISGELDNTAGDAANDDYAAAFISKAFSQSPYMDIR